MKGNLILSFVFASMVLFLSSCSNNPKETIKPEYVIVLHGGAGNAGHTDLGEDKQKEYKEKLAEALAIGENILKSGGTCLEAVEKTINYMEDCPLFNAGKGSVFTRDGHNEMDASIMLGSDLRAGAVTCVGDIKNPISAAIKVMTNSEHVLLSGKGASEFAKIQGLEIVDSSYFYTDERWNGLQKAIESEKHGTVGCVVLDKYGNLAAGTSTGGMTNKRYNRIGDTPIIGAGNYANNNTCAVSATGHGEFFIRYTVAHDISALMEYKGLSLIEAANLVVMKKLVDANGEGGIIAVDKDGNIALVFNTNMMFRAYSKSTGEKDIAIFR
ncbi:MAG: beta-aspartyl-peptidase [Bacteroidetes bacterium GWC2_33_15]|nr:MAG: beta-aspartyl-peptidase [Bacteroidetes bacterium GWA2_33_15]OFX51465.1 MAG: beta-aspartyl-peptidase [Bacteroidetes bacterium GWC2_33_15]OFX65789.1 MAG: beta-aspartyl-peptidase [Bacteroidetes bacterium GWB2_32_14]OFX69493.1 MAG: beta-aspartyl-peptidase [Bacteroidetes bacterium GWD2_33_33]HAN17750.1 beta-aspartyl-peptidase [Bacteroidales bacterium]